MFDLINKRDVAIHKFFILGLIWCMLCCTGCETYTSSSSGTTSAGIATGTTSARQSQKDKENGNRSALLDKMQESSRYRRNGNLGGSSEMLKQADEMIDVFERKASTRLGQETLSAFTNPQNITYEGWSNERIMVNTYLALDSMMAGDPDSARVWLNKAYQRQRDAVERNSKTLEAAQSNVEDSAVTSYYEQNLNKLAPLADYVNPFTSYLRGLFLMYYGEDGSDWEVARKSLEQSHAFARENEYVKQDLEQIENILNGKTTLTNVTYVIFESGKGPCLVEKRIPLLLNGEEAIPVFQGGDGVNNKFKVTAGTIREDSQIVANMDDIFGAAFRSERKKIQARANASTATRELTSSAVGAAAGTAVGVAVDSVVPGAGIFSGLFTGTVTKAVVSEVQNTTYNVADTRSWTLLPATFQICKIATPRDKTLQIADIGGSVQKTVELPSNGINLVYVQSTSSGSSLNVWMIKMKDGIDVEQKEFEEFMAQKFGGEKITVGDPFTTGAKTDSKKSDADQEEFEDFMEQKLKGKKIATEDSFTTGTEVDFKESDADQEEFEKYMEQKLKGEKN